jgi:hypothetical protein
MRPDDSRLNLVFEKIAHTGGVSRMLNLNGTQILICWMNAHTEPACKVDKLGEGRSEWQPLIIFNAFCCY